MFGRQQLSYRAVLATFWLASFAGMTSARAGVIISTAATQDMNCSAGVCGPTSQNAVLNVGDLANMLASNDVKLVSDSAALDIRFAAPLSWTSASRLTLDSYHSIVFEKSIAVAGIGALTITTNDGGSEGDFSFQREGRIQFWDLHGSLVINGNGYVLVKDLHQLADEINTNPSGFFALANNHNAAKDGAYHQSPISTYLSGTFDALGNTISDLTIANHKERSNLGLFARIAFGGVVRDVRLVNVKIKGKATSTLGALAGDNWGTIQNSEVSGTVTNVEWGPCVGSLVGFNENAALVFGARNAADLQDLGWEQSFVGGLVGCNNGTVQSSDSEGAVKSSGSDPVIGGLVGKNNSNGLIASSAASGKVTSALGGIGAALVAWNEGTVKSSAASGDVNGFDDCGGLVALNDGMILTSHASGAIVCSASGANSAGGLAAGNTGSITQSWATGSATGGQQTAVGGLVGNNSGHIEDSYAFGAATAGQGGHAGGLLGYNTGDNGGIDRAYSLGAPKADGGEAGGSIGTDNDYGSASADYWDLDTSGISDPQKGAGNGEGDPGITGLSNAKLQSRLPVGFNPNVWGHEKKVNNGYPYLIANPPPK